MVSAQLGQNLIIMIEPTTPKFGKDQIVYFVHLDPVRKAIAYKVNQTPDECRFRGIPSYHMTRLDSKDVNVVYTQEQVESDFLDEKEAKIMLAEPTQEERPLNRFTKGQVIYSIVDNTEFEIDYAPYAYIGLGRTYLLRRTVPPFVVEEYKQAFVESNFTDTPPDTLRKVISMFENKFNIRDVLVSKALVKESTRTYIIVDMPEVEFEGRMIPGYKLVPAFNSGGHEEFTIAQITAECTYDKVEDPTKHIPSVDDFAPYLIRGDVLATRLFPELKCQFYVLKVEGEGRDLRIYGRAIAKGIASNEVMSFTKRELADQYRLQTLQTYTKPITQIKYQLADTIKHIKSGEEYTICMLPNKGVLENTREPAYSFEMADGRVCHRSQKEVEDPGRFALVLSATRQSV